jgi:hypothetical protein
MTTACRCNRQPCRPAFLSIVLLHSMIRGLSRTLWERANVVQSSVNRKTPSLSLRLRFAMIATDRRLMRGWCAFGASLMRHCCAHFNSSHQPMGW